MKKKFIVTFFFILLANFFIYSHFLDSDVSADFNTQFVDEESILVTEVTGIAQVVYNKNDYKNITVGDTISSKATIITGLHSTVSIQVNNKSYITINQLSNVLFHKIGRNAKELLVESCIFDGFVVVYARPYNDFDTHVVFTNASGKIDMKNAGGQIYVGADHGTLISATHGKIKVSPKIKTLYWIRGGECCGISKDGLLIEHDEFVKRKISHIPSNIKDSNAASIFIDSFSRPFTQEQISNDYFNANQP